MRIQQTKQLLLTSLKELIQKRQQFSEVFHLLLEMKSFKEIVDYNPLASKTNEDKAVTRPSEDGQSYTNYNSCTTFAAANHKKRPSRQTGYNTKSTNESKLSVKKMSHNNSTKEYKKQFINTIKPAEAHQTLEKIETAQSHQ